MNLGLDIDGVITDTDLEFRVFAQAHYKLDKLPPSPDCYNYAEAKGWEFMSSWDDFHRAFISAGKYRSVLEIWKASSIISELAEDFRIHLVTSRPRTAQIIADTVDWLDEYQIPYDDISFVDDKTTVGVDIMIDDRVETCDDFWKQGRAALVFDAPWNQRPGTKHCRISDWEELRTVLRGVI